MRPVILNLLATNFGIGPSCMGMAVVPKEAVEHGLGSNTASFLFLPSGLCLVAPFCCVH